MKKISDGLGLFFLVISFVNLFYAHKYFDGGLKFFFFLLFSLRVEFFICLLIYSLYFMNKKGVKLIPEKIKEYFIDFSEDINLADINS